VSHPVAGVADQLIASAKEVLDGNWTGHSTLPSPTLYPHQWNWDTGFISIGRSRYDQTSAEAEMLSLFDAQWRTGMLPHIVFNPAVPADAYFPGADFWRSETSAAAPSGRATSGLTQPPVHGFAALEMHRRARDPEQSRNFLRRILPGLGALHRYFRDRRSIGSEGLTYVLHPWETGLDNSPAWDEAIESFVVVPGSLPEYERRDLMHADPRNRPSDRAYDRFVYLALLYRDAGYDDVATRALTPFLVEDPMFNAIWAWSALAVAEIADVLGEDGTEYREDAERIVRAIESKLWDEEHGRFFPFDVRDGRRMNHHSIVSFMPLVAPGLDSGRARRTVEAMRRFARSGGQTPALLLATYDERDQEFDRRLYWRGPIWVNTNWLLYRGC
jgi:mannosylglycerate hydrolase MGH1-like protein